MDKKILVTGGTGFLGSYILKALIEKGYQVRALCRSNKRPFYIPASILEKVEWIEGDVLDVVSLDDAMKGIDAVIHAAAVVSFQRSDRNLMQSVNVEGTANVVNLALENNVTRLLHVSSVAALGRSEQGGEVNEEKKWEENKLTTHYARSKFKAELEVWRGMAEGLDAVIMNPSTILGYGDWHHSSCAIFRNIYKGFKWSTPGINGFVDVADTARAAVLLLESNISGERFIINGDNWPFKQLMFTIADRFGVKRPDRLATPTLTSIAWRLEAFKSFFTRQKPLLTRESARVAHSYTRFSNHKLLEALPGFAFTPLEQSIENACRMYSQAAHK
ncbi:MAG: SDR family NAD(P)-dependent oxidoreductase [Chitinophagaceae bacterium]|nr:SDR family NAD(P)-dependent oxidoreductase [Chitinophagaceae bacterium]